MSTKLPRGLWFGLALLLSVSGFRLANAPAVAAQDSQAEYQSLIQKGLREYELGNFGEARAFFLRAHQQSPNARTLRGLGMAAYELRHYVEASDYFQRALASPERPLTADMQAEVSQLLTQARSFITRLKLEVTPAQAQLRLDTREVVRDSDGSVLLDPGTHELVVEAASYETITRSIRCEGGETLRLALALPRVQAADQLQGPGQGPLSAAGAVDRGEPGGSSRVAPYVVIGTATAVSVAGGVLLAIALRNKHAVEHPEQSAAGPRYSDYQGKADSVLPLSAAGITALSIGLAGVAAGITWKLANGEHAPSTDIALSPAGFALSGRF